MEQDVIRAKVIEFTRKVEEKLPDQDGLHAASKRLRNIIENIGNAAKEKLDD